MDTTGTVTGKPNDTTAARAHGVDQMTASVHERITAVSDAARPAVDRTAAAAHSAVDRVAGVATHAAEAFDLKGEQLKGAEKKLVAATREYMHTHPVASIGIAIAAGFVLSRILSSR